MEKKRSEEMAFPCQNKARNENSSTFFPGCCYFSESDFKIIDI